MTTNSPIDREESIFHQALEIDDPESRNVFLVGACRDDDKLLLRLKSLLEQTDRSTFFLDGNAANMGTSKGISSNPDAQLGNDHVPVMPSTTDGSIRMLGKYEVLEQIGKGGMGVVFHGFDPGLRRHVALKVQLKSYGDAGLARFKAEARAVAALDVHPNIIRIHELDIENDPPFIVMEYVNGINLGEFVHANGPVQPDSALNHILDAAKGLQFAHENGILHRDVKPQNLLLDSKSIVKVLDLGLARLPLTNTQSTTENLNTKTDSQAGGSIEFMSPEQSRSLADATAKSDVYSLGCTFYFLLSGKLPFQSDNPIEVIDAHRTARRPSLNGHLKETPKILKLDSLVQRMMAINPDDRIPDMATVIKEITSILDQVTQAKRRARKRILVGMLSSAFFLMLVAVVWFLRPPNYRFELEGVSDITEVRALVNLHEELVRLEKWESLYSSNSKELSHSIRRSPAAKVFKECVQDSESVKLGALMKALVALDRHFGGKIPEGWRALDVTNLSQKVEIALREIHRSDLRSRVEKYLSRAESKSTLQRWGIVDFPASTSSRNQDRWIKALDEAIKNDVQPVSRWYDSIVAMGMVEFNGNSGTDLVLKLRQNEILFRGFKSTANFEVWARYPSKRESTDNLKSSQDGQVTEIDTGIRLVDCLMVKDELGGGPALHWPPTEGIVDHSKFENFARFLGIHRSFEIRSEKLSFVSSSSKPSFQIEFEFKHEDVGPCSGTSKVQFDVLSPSIVTYDPKAFDTKSNSLASLIQQITSYRGFPVRFSPVVEGSVFNGKLIMEKLPIILFQTTIDADQQLRVSLAPNVEVRDALAKAICAQSTDLKGLEPFSSITSIQIDRVPAQLSGVAVIDRDESFSCHWALDPTGKWTLNVDSEMREKAKIARNKKPTIQTKVLDSKALSEEIKRSIRKLGAISSIVDEGSVSCNDLGNYFTLGIRIGDWLPIRLGPYQVGSIQDVDQLVKSSIAKTSFLPLANAQLAIERSHPRFGRSIQRLTDWNPTEATAKISTRMLLTDRSLPLDVEEQVRVVPGGIAIETKDLGSSNWVASNDKSLARRLRPSAKNFCQTVSQAIENASGLKVVVDLDDDDLRKPWIQFNPPVVFTEVRVVVPVLDGLEFGIGKLKIGPGSLSLPKSIMVQPRMSVPCGYFTASDPRCEIDFDEKKLSLGFKVTPPFPSAGIPIADRNLGTLSRYGVNGLSISSVRWDNLFLHAGHVFVQADGRLAPFGGAGENLVSIGTQGNIVLLEDTQLAQCRGEIDLVNWQMKRLSMRIDSELHPNGCNIGSLTGEFVLSPSETEKMKISGNAELRGFELTGCLAYKAENDKARIRVDANSLLPVVGTAKINGVSDLSFRDYRLSGEGKVPVPMVGYQVHYRVESSQHNTKFDWWWETSDGRTIRYTTESPRMDLIDEQALLAELSSVVELSKDSMFFKTEKQSDARRPNPEVDKASPRAIQFKAPLFDIDDETPPPPQVTLDIKGNALRVLHQDPPYKEYASLDSITFGQPNWDEFDIWTGWTPDEQFGIFAVKPAIKGGAIYTALLSEGATKIPAIELNARETKFATISNALHPRRSAATVLLNQAVLLDAIEMRIHGYSDVDWKEKGEFISISGTKSKGGVVKKTYALDSNGLVRRLTYVGLDENNLSNAMKSFSQGIPGVSESLSSDWSLVSFRRILGKDCCAVISRSAKDSFLMHVLFPEGKVTVNLDRMDATKASVVFAHAARIADALWDGIMSNPITGYVGTAGSCTCSANGWCLIPTSFTGSLPLSVHWLSKRQFDEKWTDLSNNALPSSEILLPKALQTSAQRAKVNVHDIGRVAVCEWESLKHETNQDQKWLAHPMGLLIEQSKRTKEEGVNERR